jgi:E3 ubiquitin-protein ligase DOA10
MKETISCFICLVDLSRPKKTDLPCSCKPYLHQRCLNKWFKHNINECPICRVDYEEYGSPPEPQPVGPVIIISFKLKLIFGLIYLGIIFCLLIILIQTMAF